MLSVETPDFQVFSIGRQRKISGLSPVEKERGRGNEGKDKENGRAERIEAASLQRDRHRAPPPS